MASLTQEERQYALQLLKHPVIFKLFDELEDSRLNEAVTCRPTDTDKINAALGEVRAVRNLRQTLELIGFENERKQAVR
jgi:hypothetical protein